MITNQRYIDSKDIRRAPGHVCEGCFPRERMRGEQTSFPEITSFPVLMQSLLEIGIFNVKVKIDIRRRASHLLPCPDAGNLGKKKCKRKSLLEK